jgi:uncharacterized membrane protein YkgB
MISIPIILSTAAIYTCAYSSVLYNKYLASLITPKTFKKNKKTSTYPFENYKFAHELVTYAMSTIHGTTIATVSLLNLLGVIPTYYVYNTYCFSIGYFISDIGYLLLTSNHLHNFLGNYKSFLGLEYLLQFTKHDLLLIIHHILVIHYEIFTVNSTGYLKVASLYYFSKIFLAEYAVIPLNMCWYLKNTVVNYKESHIYKANGILLLVTYFLFRVVNFILILYNLYVDNLMLYGMLGLPIIGMNYYWFYKICRSVKSE